MQSEPEVNKRSSEARKKSLLAKQALSEGSIDILEELHFSREKKNK